MSHVFKNQTLLTIVVETEYASLGSATVKQIHYTKPSGATGSWDATVSGTTLVYNIEDGDIDEAGVWQFQSYIEIGGEIAFGKIAKHTFGKPL